MSRSRLSFYRIDNLMVVHFNGHTKHFQFKKIEDSEEMYAKIKRIKKNLGLHENSKEYLEAYNELSEIMDKRFIVREKSGLLMKSNGYYFEGIDIPVPEGILKRVSQLAEEENYSMIDSLKNFWTMLALNPNREIHNSIFNFADHFHFPITDKGYFIAYKSVLHAGNKSINEVREIHSKYIYCISNKINTEDVFVYKCFEHEGDGVYSKKADIVFVDNENLKEFQANMDGKDSEEDHPLFIYEFQSNLKDYYKNSMNRLENPGEGFTDHYTKTFDIQLGEPVKEERELCDPDPRNSCSKGLHVGTPNYVKNYGNKESVVIACLVSPMNVVSIPNDYNSQKMRVCEYLPYAICEFDENGNIYEIETKFFEEDYMNIEVKSLENMAAELKKRVDRKSEILKGAIQNRLSIIS